MGRYEATVLTLVLLMDRVGVNRVIVILFIDSNTTPPAIWGGSFSVSNLCFCRTADRTDSGTFVFVNLSKFMIHLYLRDRGR